MKLVDFIKMLKENKFPENWRVSIEFNGDIGQVLADHMQLEVNAQVRTTPGGHTMDFNNVENKSG